MDYETLVGERRSIRGYQKTQVPKEVIDEIITVAKGAPSSMNTQPWHFHVITGAPLPDGWAGKMWALEQARNHATTPLVLLLDADIELAPGLLATLKMRRLKTGARFISLKETSIN